MDFAVFGIAVAPLVRALVDILKRFGVSGKGCLVAAMVVAGALYGIKEAAALYPAVEPWFQIAVGILSAALWASTLYETQQALTR